MKRGVGTPLSHQGPTSSGPWHSLPPPLYCQSFLPKVLMAPNGLSPQQQGPQTLKKRSARGARSLLEAGPRKTETTPLERATFLWPPEGGLTAVFTAFHSTPRPTFGPGGRATARSGEQKSKPKSRGSWVYEICQKAQMQTRISPQPGHGHMFCHLPDLKGTWKPRCSE